MNVASLFYELRPSQRRLFTTILKRVKESAYKRRTNFNPVACTKTPQGLNNVKTYWLNRTNLILQSLPRPKCSLNGTMVNTAAEEPIKCAILRSSDIAMLRPENIQEEMLVNKLNLIGHGKGLYKELVET